MSKINAIQNGIKELEGGRFQKLFDAYLYKKRKFENIQTLGVQDGTDKPTKGTPDSYIINPDGTYTFIMYGTVGDKAFEKLKKDILSCLDYKKVKIEESKISKIICAYSNTNINAGQMEELRNLVAGNKVELIGIDTISHDLLINYPFLAEEFLDIPIGTSQIYDVEDFIEVYDRTSINSPLNINFIARNKEQEELYSNINLNIATLITGASGIGKTRLIIEVCKKFEIEGWKVLCVKNNGSYLLDDIKYYINGNGKYLLFIDDANQTTSLDAVLSYVNEVSVNKAIKVVMSVRDYAKERLVITVNKYCKPVVQNITALGNDEIKEMLKENFNISNGTYLERITSIAKGNARLAVLAGKVSKEKGYLAISNVIDIFHNYYGRILNDLTLSDELVNVLFVISLLGKIQFKENATARNLLEVFGINVEKFDVLCCTLNDKELIDLYYNEIAQISDQSFGDFILHYVLIDKKYISIEQLLDIGFSDFKNKIIYALNTIINLFDSKETRKYIEQQVKNMWNKVSPDLQWEYLKSFHTLNQEKTLSVLKQRISAIETINFNLDTYDFEQERKNRNVKSEEIEVLCNFKYTDYYEDAIELLLLYYSKRPDMVVEFYYAFTDKMGYDELSYRFEYKKELILVQKLWNSSKEGNNKNVTFLLVRVLGCFLECRFHKTSLENNRTIKMYNFSVPLIDGSKKLRSFIWKVLATVYVKGLYTDFIHNLLKKNHIDYNDKGEARKVFCFDYKIQKEYFFSCWGVITFEQCKVLKAIEKNFCELGLEPDSYVGKYKENEEYVVYDVLQEVHDLNLDWKKEQELRKDRIERFVSNYVLNDYRNLFLLCKKFERLNDENGYQITNGIHIIFNKIKSDVSKLYDAIDVYLQCNCPYGANIGWYLELLVEYFGTDAVLALIEKYEFDYKNQWLCYYYSCLKEENIDEKVMRNFASYIHSQSLQDVPYVPDVEHLLKYKKVDKSITDEISNIILHRANKNHHLVTTYLGWNTNNETIKMVLEFFASDIVVLEELYLCAIKDHYDYDGALFLKILEQDDSFWEKFTKHLSDVKHKTMYDLNIFDHIWKMEDYEHKINIAFIQMIGDDFWLGKKDVAEIIFCNKENTPEDIRIRKKMWLQNYIALNFSVEQKMITILGLIVDVLPLYKKELILEVTKYRKDVDFFKKIPLFPMYDSWTGSEVPVIDRKIEFINDLMASLKGIDFIEHRNYLNNEKEIYEREKHEVLVREHILNMDLI